MYDVSRLGAISFQDFINDIQVPEITVPDLDSVSDDPMKKSDIFEDHKRAAWKNDQPDEARCDFAPNKIRINFRNPLFGIISLWKKSVYGRTLSDIKDDPDMVGFFSVSMARLIRQMLGDDLHSGDWCIVTAPKRRHKIKNFASLVSERIARILNIKFYEDMALCNSRQRVGAVFEFGHEPPEETNVIVFDDIVTTGSTMIAMRNLLISAGKNTVFFTAINNEI